MRQRPSPLFLLCCLQSRSCLEEPPGLHREEPSSSKALWLRKPCFKNAKMTQTDDHDLFLFCLWEEHNVTPKAQGDRAFVLKTALWEKALGTPTHFSCFSATRDLLSRFNVVPSYLRAQLAVDQAHLHCYRSAPLPGHPPQRLRSRGEASSGLPQTSTS